VSYPIFAVNLLHGEMQQPMFLTAWSHPGFDGLEHQGFAGQDIPETLKSIDLLWRASGRAAPRPSYRFIDSYLEAAYAAILRQQNAGQYFVRYLPFSSPVLACFGLAAFTAERRTKENRRAQRRWARAAVKFSAPA